MRSDGVVVDPPPYRQDLHLFERKEDLASEELIRSLKLNLLQKAFSQGLPGSMESVFAPVSANHFRRSFATNSGPLSERICSGTPCNTIKSGSDPITFALDQRRSGRTSKLSLVCSSIRFNILTVLPSYVFAVTKLQIHTWLQCFERHVPWQELVD